jgi:TatD DNase family protein
MAQFYDTHAHLDYPEFQPDLVDLVARAQSAGISRIISIGTALESSRRAVQLAERFDCVYAVVGWHPSDATQAPADLRPALRELARHPKVVALGETGLDYHRLPSQKPGFGPEDDDRYKRRQADLFAQHLEVAAEMGINCVIHQRDSLEDTLALFAAFASRVRGVFHCFGNDPAAMRRVLALGSLVSFTGTVTFKNGQNVRDTVRETPLDKLMVETDCPFLAPVPYRGKRCEPAYVRQIAESVAQVKGCDMQELSDKTCATARDFFPKLKDLS